MFDLSGIRSVEELTNIEGKRVLVRVDFSIPTDENGKLRDTFQIDTALPTIRLLLSRGAKVILISHQDGGESLSSVASYLNEQVPVSFLKDRKNISFEKTSLVLLENLRLSPLEEANDEGFARELASLADYYVNEAFAVSHREHASLLGVPNFLPSFAGLRMLEEVRELSLILSPEHPFFFIVGGAKVKTKGPLLRKLLGLADGVFVGGVLANDFLKSKGYEVGNSLLSGLPVDSELVSHSHTILPEDLVVYGPSGRREVSIEGVGAEETIADVGPRTLLMLEEKIREARTLLWNGPLGLYEKGFAEGTLAVAKAVASSSGHTVLGGGDTLSVFPQSLKSKVSFVSTGGGAMLRFLSEETLPALEALKRVD